MRPTRLLLLGLALSSASISLTAVAQQRRPTDFQAPREMSEEEIRAAKERSKSNLHRYDKGVTDEVKPIPWLAISLVVIVFAIATPFALRYYKDTASEIRDRNGPGAVRGAARPVAKKAAPRPADDA